MLKHSDHKALKFTVIVVTSLSVASCAGVDTNEANYSDDYINALESYQGTPTSGPIALATFIDAISDLKHEDSATRLENAYAETLYFNDTIHTYTDRDLLIEYLLKTAERVESIDVEVHDIASNNNDYYIRWVMKMRFEISNDMIDSTSIGMSHIRVNEQGKVVLHQDYWDGVQGLYRHIPVVGYLLGKVQAKM